VSLFEVCLEDFWRDRTFTKPADYHFGIGKILISIVSAVLPSPAQNSSCRRRRPFALVHGFELTAEVLLYCIKKNRLPHSCLRPFSFYPTPWLISVIQQRFLPLMLPFYNDCFGSTDVTNPPSILPSFEVSMSLLIYDSLPTWRMTSCSAGMVHNRRSRWMLRIR
jgi:hypothetical protein